MQAPDPSAFEGLPPLLQTVVTAAVGVGAAIAAGWTYVSRLRREPAKPVPDLVLTSAALTDMGPMREVARQTGDLVLETRASRQALDRILAILEEGERDREIDRRVREALAHSALSHIERIRSAAPPTA